MEQIGIHWEGGALGLGSPLVDRVIIFNNKLIAHGTFQFPYQTLCFWNGSSWIDYNSTELPSSIYDIAVYNNEFYAGGNFQNDTNGQVLNFIARRATIDLLPDTTTCFNTCNAEVSVTVIGVAPDSYLWSTGDTTQAIQNLCPGIYTVTIIDSTGSSSFGTVTITSPPEIIITDTSTDASCSSCSNGSATINVSGGVPPLSHEWSNGETTNSIDSLTAGTYYATVTDGNGCVVNDSVTVGFDVGVKQWTIDNGQLIIYPNPANETVTITAEDIKEVVVSDLLGVQMMRLLRTDYNSNNDITIDISKLPQGIYLLRVQINDGWRVDKVVKE